MLANMNILSCTWKEVLHAILASLLERLSIGHSCFQAFLQLTVESLHLAVSLWVVRRCLRMAHSVSRQQLLQLMRDKLRSVIADQLINCTEMTEQIRYEVNDGRRCNSSFITPAGSTDKNIKTLKH